MIRGFHFGRLLALTAIGAALVGCSDGNTPPLGDVHGQVTYNGTPVDGCNVIFTPAASGRSSSAVTDADGYYVLKYSATAAGALVGEHRVELTTARDRIVSDEGQLRDAGRKEIFPKEYNAETTQVVEVTGWDNTIDFHVVGK
ncbi:carboxypeptidase-like regulatory domain-containing protein [Blastopirellula sp. JC732]|uniref:Carboxypeptidase-like regulatory domain-containing protein n=1 Tax=Blastopirellula sediminis TaxID=2894196 RepID=A0A9X1SJI9_9BACT|nr:carboxypeptidase-like regulatory domain-containing protein [Blastopirellula sediminis]MCC9604680.1 carboxypeptidase-like regulatory domain-containing protein [Blastopirellula sediminis]MCC9632021.1 carboxypeptidase-like regulatory domain-containing protein [Blastopirellula sediminis]